MFLFFIGLILGANISLFLYALIKVAKESDVYEYDNESVIK